MEENSKDRQMYQLHKKGYEEIAKAASKGISININGAKVKDVNLTTPKAIDGKPGKDGTTPVKGKDYFTAEELHNITQDVLKRIPKPENGKDGIVDYDLVKVYIEDQVSKIKIPKPIAPKDVVVDYDSIVKEVLGKIPTPKDGVVDYDKVKNYIQEAINKTYQHQSRLLNSGGPTTRLGELVDVNLDGATLNQVLLFNGTDWVPGTASGGSGAVDSVNSQTGVVLLDADDIDDTSTTHKFVTATDIANLGNLSGTNSGDQIISDATITTTDITTNNASTTKHGFLKKLSNVATEYMDGTGAWSVPAGGAATPAGSDTYVQYNDAGSFGAMSQTNDAVRWMEDTGDYTFLVGKTSGSNAKMEINNAASDSTRGNLRIISTGTAGADYDIRIDSPDPDIEMNDTTQVAPAGVFEFGIPSGNDCFGISGRNSTNTAFDNPSLYVYRKASGAMLGINTNFSTPEAQLEVVPSGSLDPLHISTAVATSGDIAKISQAGTMYLAGSLNLGHASDTTLSRVSAGKIAVEGVNVVTTSSTDTLTNKRITPRVLSATSYTTDTGTSINGDTQDMFIVTAQAGALKFNNPTGTPTDGQKLIISVASSTTSARALTWDTLYGATTVALPTTTAATTATLTIGFIYSSSKTLWQCVAVA